MEISLVRNHLNRAINRARERAQQRRVRASEAEQAYAKFLQDVATPMVQMVANVLKVENYAFTVFTPAGGLRLAADRGRDDYIEFLLDTSGDQPQVLGRISRTRGSRTLTDERPLKPDAAPDAISDEDVLAFLTDALGPWLER